jgi:hypothetical protein
MAYSSTLKMETVRSLGALVLYGVKDSNLQYRPTVIFQKHQNVQWHYDQNRKNKLQSSGLYNFSMAEDYPEDGHSMFSETLAPTCQTACSIRPQRKSLTTKNI